MACVDPNAPWVNRERKRPCALRQATGCPRRRDLRCLHGLVRIEQAAWHEDPLQRLGADHKDAAQGETRAGAIEQWRAPGREAVIGRRTSCAVPKTLQPFWTSTSMKLTHTRDCARRLRALAGEAMVAIVNRTRNLFQPPGPSMPAPASDAATHQETSA